MKMKRHTNRMTIPRLLASGSALTAAIALSMVGTADAQKTPGYNTEIPEYIMTPDKVETRIGTLEFFDGIPTKETAALLYDNLDFLRGVETFLNGIPATSVEGIKLGMERLGLTNSNQALIFDELMDSNPLFLTGNTSTVYCSVMLDLKKDGPTVVEVPAGSGPGTVNDAYFRFVTDMGPPGPDRGKGGKYLILPPDFEGEAPEGYYTAKSTSWVNWLILRGFLKDGKPDYSSKLFRNGLKVYPLAKADNPPKMEFLNGSKKLFNTIHANNYEFFGELHAIIEREPVEMWSPELLGLFSSIGIQKGKPFAPDERMKKILTDAVAVGNGTSRALLWYERDKSEFFNEKTYWKRGFIGNSYEYLRDEGKGGRHLDARTHFYYFATVNTPAMAMKLVDKGSKYAWGYLDAKGNHLDGGKNYKLNLPKDPPAKQFMSICLYDPQTRSLLQTTQALPSYSSVRDKDKVSVNDDGSVDLYFGPKAPEGKERNWLETVPGKGWFVLLRLYSPTEDWYDGKWLPGEFELVK